MLIIDCSLLLLLLRRFLSFGSLLGFSSPDSLLLQKFLLVRIDLDKLEVADKVIFVWDTFNVLIYIVQQSVKPPMSVSKDFEGNTKDKRFAF